MDEIVQNTDFQETIPEEPKPQLEENSDETNVESSTKQGNTDSSSLQKQDEFDGKTALETKNNTDFFEIRYNHENIKLSREEAAKYAGLGKRYSGLFENLNMLARSEGKTSEEYVETLLNSQVEKYKAELFEKLGEDKADIVEKLAEQFKNERFSNYENFKSQEKENMLQSTESRLAKEFSELISEIPELADTKFENLPESVKQSAVYGKNLTAAYLLYKRQEEKKIANAVKLTKEIKNASIGNLNSVGEIETSADEFAKGAFFY